MQEDAIEVSFCDLCGASVPAGDLQSGAAVQRLGKTVGACCLEVFRGAGAGVVSAGAGAWSLRSAGTAGSRSVDNLLLPAVIVLLAAIAAATIFLDYRVNNFEQSASKVLGELGDRQAADSSVLMGLDPAVQRLAGRAELEATSARLAELAAAVASWQDGSAQKIEGLQEELAAVKRELARANERAVDYRPLFEDLRDRHQRSLLAIEALRGLAVAQPVPAPAVPTPGPAEPANPASGLPPELAAQAARLADKDPAVRFEAVDLLVRSKNPEVLPFLLPMTGDADSFVRRYAVEGLREFPRAASIEALLKALEDDEERVRDTAWHSLLDTTGQKFPFEATASRDNRARAVQRWRDWWDKAKATFGS